MVMQDCVIFFSTVNALLFILGSNSFVILRLKVLLIVLLNLLCCMQIIFVAYE